MRTWGRVPVASGSPSASGTFIVIGKPVVEYEWVEVTTDVNGFNDAVWLTTLAQVLQLNLNESPIFGSYGVPSQQSIVTQVFPDYYVNLTQQLFAVYFLALIISKIESDPPTYNVNPTANPGAVLMSPVPI